MQAHELYHRKPTTMAQLTKFSRAICAVEAALIDEVLANHGLRAGVVAEQSYATGSFFAYSLSPHRGSKTTVAQIMSLHKDIQKAVSDLRRQQTTIRMSDSPLVIETPSPWPQPILPQSMDWEIGKGRMLCGRSFDPYEGQQQITLNLANGHHHALVVGASGAGKTMLMQGMLASYCRVNSPAETELYIIDMKGGQDLGLFHNLPHVRTVATDIDEAAAVVDHVHGILDHRRRHPDEKRTRVLLVVDEQAEFHLADKRLWQSDPTLTVAKMNTLANQGRGFDIHLLIGTQRPTAKQLGNFNVSNMTIRIVGWVGNPNDAQYAAGRGGTGAESLAKPGGFLFIDGQREIRFQSVFWPSEVPNTPSEVLHTFVQRIGKYWREQGHQALHLSLADAQERPQRPQQAQQPVMEDNVNAADETFLADVAKAEKAFDAFWNPAEGDVVRGCKTAIIRAVFGEGKPTAGYYIERADSIINYLKERARKQQVDDKKIIHLRHRTA